MARVQLRNLTKVYPGGVKAVDGIDLDIADQEFVVLVGPSGCGKSTTLRMIAGLEDTTGGEIWIGDRRVNDIAPRDRDLAMVFQNYALYPHMTVRQNMSFGLRLRLFPGIIWRWRNRAAAASLRRLIDQRVIAAARLLDIEHLLDRKPRQLSGGQRQRVAVGRAIVREPRAFLFDEPLSNLDAKLRVTTRAELKRLHRRLKVTTIYVTHDQEEAMTLGDRIVVMKDGVIQQADTPLETYLRPANRFVAGFIGMPPMNFFDGVIESDGSGLIFREGKVEAAPASASSAPSPGTLEEGWGEGSFSKTTVPPEEKTLTLPSPGVLGERSSMAPRTEKDTVPKQTSHPPPRLTLAQTGFTIALPAHLQAALEGFIRRHVVLGIRPEHFHLSQRKASTAIPVRLNMIEPLGNDMDVYASTRLHDPVVARLEAGPGLAIDDQAVFYAELDKIHFFAPGSTGKNLCLMSESAHALA